MKFMFFLLLLVFSNLGFAQSAEDVLKSLQNKFDSISDLTVNFNQKSAGKSLLSGTMFFKKENKIRLEIENQLIISDGESIWNYSKKQNKVVISNYEEEGAGLLSINYIVYKYPSECDLELSSEGSNDVLILKPKTKKNNMGVVKLYISKDFTINKAEISGNTSGISEIVFSNYKLNQKLSESKFLFKQPEGTSVVDLR
jgi:chaperone LolA